MRSNETERESVCSSCESDGAPVCSSESRSNPKSSIASSAVCSVPCGILDSMRLRTSAVSQAAVGELDASNAIASDSTVGSSREGISRVGDSSEPRSGASSTKSRSDDWYAGASPVAAVELLSCATSAGGKLLCSPSGSPNKSMSTRFSPPSRFRSTNAPAPMPPPVLLENSASSGQICLPMMRIFSHSPAGARSRLAYKSFADCRNRSLLPQTK